LVVGSDGLFEFIEDDELCGALLATHADCQAQGIGAEHLQVALEELREEARARWVEREGCIDDCTILLARVGY